MIKVLDSFHNSKHNLRLIDYFNYNIGIKTDIYLVNIISKNNLNNNNRLFIIIYL